MYSLVTPVALRVAPRRHSSEASRCLLRDPAVIARCRLDRSARTADRQLFISDFVPPATVHDQPHRHLAPGDVCRCNA